jgi:hypothetical protein
MTVPTARDEEEMTTAAAAVDGAVSARRGGWSEVVRLANEAQLTAEQVADLLRYGISGKGLPIPGPEPRVPELTEKQVKAAVYRGAARVLGGGIPEPPDELEVRLLVALEAALLSKRAEQEGLKHCAALLAQCALVPPVVSIALQRMVSKVVAAAPPLPPVPDAPVKTGKR